MPCAGFGDKGVLESYTTPELRATKFLDHPQPEIREKTTTVICVCMSYFHFLFCSYVILDICIYIYEQRSMLLVKLKDMDVGVIVFCVSHIVLQVKATLLG